MAERGQIFKEAPIETPNYSWFDMSFDFPFSMNMGELVPSACVECLGGDTIHSRSGVFARLSAMVAPAFGKLNFFNYSFYVRNRDIWKSWDSFITNKDIREPWQQERPFTPPVMPYLDVRKILYNGLWSHSSQQVQPSINNLTNSINYDGIFEGSYFLIVTFDPNTKQKAVYVTREPNLAGLAITNSYVFQFIPDKQDLIGNSDNQFYNPFGESSLFDYLGMDISGVQKFDFDSTLQEAFAAIPYSDEETGTIPALYVLNTEYKDVVAPQSVSDNEFGTELTDSRFIDVTGIDINKFLSSRTILSVAAFCKPTPESTISYWITYNCATGVPAASSGTHTRISAALFETETGKISALPLRAYYYIYSQYFRDQNYIGINKNVDFTRDGEDIDWDNDLEVIFDYLTLKKKAWEHDPYTTALPQPQKGEAVHFLPSFNQEIDVKVVDSPNVSPNVQGSKFLTVKPNNDFILGYAPFKTPADLGETSFDSVKLVADANLQFSGATIENFRFANATQRLLEKMARAGSRYYEFMLSIFGVSIDDAKLNRPIYLGGDKSPIQISEVLQTSATEADQPLGQMAGRAITTDSNDYIEYDAPDHGFFIELCCVIPRVSYQQGIAPMFLRKVQLDYPFPEYAQLGEEQVPVSELYYRASVTDEQPLGYQSRYYTWKYNRDKVSGAFKSSLDHWTFARKFDSAPVIGRKFLEVSPSYRQFAVADSRYEHVFVIMHHDLNIKRCLPIFGVPTL